MWIRDEIYREIIKTMPIPCVDLLVTDRDGRILMVKRKNEPVKGQWWFPGGRVFYKELRIEAAKRKLKEECGLEAVSIKEMGTFDLIFDDQPNQDCSIHGITTVFDISVENKLIKIDNQSTEFNWDYADSWLSIINNAFLGAILIKKC